MVQAKRTSGSYNNAREARGTSLRKKSETDWLRAQAAIGYAQIGAGEAIFVTSKKAFIAFVRGD